MVAVGTIVTKQTSESPELPVEQMAMSKKKIALADSSSQTAFDRRSIKASITPTIASHPTHGLTKSVVMLRLKQS